MCPPDSAALGFTQEDDRPCSFCAQTLENLSWRCLRHWHEDTMPSSHQPGLDHPGLPFGWRSNGLRSRHLFELTLHAQDSSESHLLLLFPPLHFTDNTLTWGTGLCFLTGEGDRVNLRSGSPWFPRLGSCYLCCTPSGVFIMDHSTKASKESQFHYYFFKLF